MKRLEFLTKMRHKLEQGGLAADEIDDAMSYYEELFLDAGMTNEEATAAQLGDPEELAREILIENGIHADGKAEFMIDEVNVPDEERQRQNNGGGYTYSSNAAFSNSYNGYSDVNRDQAQRNRNNFILKVIILVLTAPIWGGLLVGAIGLLIGLFAGMLGVTIALVAAGVGFLIAGFATLFAVPPIAICLLGGGCIALGLFGLAARPVLGFLFGTGIDLIRRAVEGIRRLLAGGM